MCPFSDFEIGFRIHTIHCLTEKAPPRPHSLAHHQQSITGRAGGRTLRWGWGQSCSLPVGTPLSSRADTREPRREKPPTGRFSSCKGKETWSGTVWRHRTLIRTDGNDWTTLPISWETCMQVKRQQLEPHMEQLVQTREKEDVRMDTVTLFI